MLCRSGYAMSQWLCYVAVAMLCRSGYAMLQWLCCVAVTMLCCSGYVEVIIRKVVLSEKLTNIERPNHVAVAMLCHSGYVEVAMLCSSSFAYGYVDENFSRKTAICFVYWSVSNSSYLIVNKM